MVTVARKRASRRALVPEHTEAVNFMRAVRLAEANEPALRLLFAVPNGGDRNPIVAKKMQAEGVRPGVPDYLFPVKRGAYTGLAIELKSMTGTASREQRDWIEALRAQGWRAEVCRGWSCAWDVLTEYLQGAA
jgi:hypothetical protein